MDKIEKVNFPFLPRHWPFYFGLYEPETVELLKGCLSTGDTFVDIGANVGYFSALALNYVGTKGQVFAFEPEKAHFERLFKLSTLNPEFNFHVFNSAVSNITGIATLFVSNHAGWHSLNHQFQSETHIGTQEVTTTSLDTFCIDHELCGFGAIKLLKIDVEGAEDMVMKGAENLLSEHWAQVIFIEVTPENFAVIREAFDKTEYCLHRYDLTTKHWRLFNDISINHQENLVARIAR